MLCFPVSNAVFNHQNCFLAGCPTNVVIEAPKQLKEQGSGHPSLFSSMKIKKQLIASLLI